MIRFIQQSIRLCSNQQSLKAKQEEQQLQHQQPNKVTNAADYHISKAINSEFWNIVPEPLVHSPDVGQQFYASQLTVRLATPEQLQPKPDNDDDVLFGKQFTDHMLKIYYHKSLGGWQKPQITPLENLVMHPAAKVLHYAVEVIII